MPQSATLIYIHFIWSTWDRAPVIQGAWENRIYSCIREKCLELRCEALAIGGIENHVHVLARLHADVSVAQLAKGMKGTSSFLFNHEISPQQEFKWPARLWCIKRQPHPPVKDLQLYRQPERTSRAM